jgi:hypothetical protein
LFAKFERAFAFILLQEPGAQTKRSSEALQVGVHPLAHKQEKVDGAHSRKRMMKRKGTGREMGEPGHPLVPWSESKARPLFYVAKTNTYGEAARLSYGWPVL